VTAPTVARVRTAASPITAGTPTPTGKARFPLIGWIGAGVVATAAAVALFAPRLAGYRVTELAGEPLEAPSASHLLGTNVVGQDVASQMVYGARMSLFIAIVAGGLTVFAGALVGMTAGWLGGKVDAIVMRLVDVVLVIPSLPLLIVLGAYAGPEMTTIAVIIAATAWPPSARVIRSQVLSLRRRAHLQASVGFGARTPHVLRHHVLPDVGLILAAGFVGAASRAVMMEAGLAFLGLGDPTRASWGRVMRDAIDFDALFNTTAWSWWLLPPSIAIAVFLLGMTFLGIGLEQRINPRLARHGGSQRRAR
jgi:peptide/nickel transport system permease protein